MDLFRRHFAPGLWSDNSNTPALPDFSPLDRHCAHIPPIARDSFITRQDSLAQTLRALGVSAYVAEPGASAGYYANLTGSHWGLSERPLLLIVQPQEAADGSVRANISILTPAFEKTRARLLPIPSKSRVTYTAWPEDADPFATALQLLPNLEDTIIYVDGNVRTFVTDGLQKAAPNSRVLNAPVEVRRLRERKSSEELDIMKCVNEVSWDFIERSRRLINLIQATVLAIRAARKHMRIGIKESEAKQLVINALTAAGLKDAFSLTLFGGGLLSPPLQVDVLTE